MPGLFRKAFPERDSRTWVRAVIGRRSEQRMNTQEKFRRQMWHDVATDCTWRWRKTESRMAPSF